MASKGYNVEAFVDPTGAITHFVNVNPSHYNMAILVIRLDYVVKHHLKHHTFGNFHMSHNMGSPIHAPAY